MAATGGINISQNRLQEDTGDALGKKKKKETFLG